MGLKKSGVKKGTSRFQDSGLFGITDKATPTSDERNTIANFPVPLVCQARKSAVTAMLKAEYRKAQAITLIQQTSIR